MRTRYTLINMLVNIGGQFFTMLLSFISRMVFIRCLSAAYLGVNGLFTDAQLRKIKDAEHIGKQAVTPR